jgi:ubiquinol-cytochrome c reductase cytochrome b subunit
VFGSATLFLLLPQAITGMFLAVYYAPTPNHAYDSIQFIEERVTLGALVRGLHHWGASGMVVAIGLHIQDTRNPSRPVPSCRRCRRRNRSSRI